MRDDRGTTAAIGTPDNGWRDALAVPKSEAKSLKPSEDLQ